MDTQYSTSVIQRGQSKVKNILFPTDFSSHAMKAFTYALNVADQIGANIYLYHAYHYAATGEFYIVPELIQQIHTELKESALDEFQDYEVKAREVCKNPFNLAFRADADFAVEGILRTANEVSADMIIMGTEGAANLMERWLGSVSSQVIERADIPVLVVPKDFKNKEIDNIVYATNFEEPGLNFPDEVILLRDKLKSKLTCLHIRSLSEQKEDSYTSQLDLIKELTKENGVSYKILHGVNPWEGIQDYLEEEHVDLLVMFTHHHSLIEKLLNGSLTRKAILLSKVPILVLHA
ncbi:MAG: universal stress protein [Bacteroidia bacterium]|nr:universal stress protein [Bacteroidia bacterium]